MVLKKIILLNINFLSLFICIMLGFYYENSFWGTLRYIGSNNIKILKVWPYASMIIILLYLIIFGIKREWNELCVRCIHYISHWITLLCILLVLFGGVGLFRSIEIAIFGKRMQGEVIQEAVSGNIAKLKSEGKVQGPPIVRVLDTFGNEHLYHCDYTSSARVRKGDVVYVYVIPDDYVGTLEIGKAAIDSFPELWLIPICMFLPSLLILQYRFVTIFGSPVPCVVNFAYPE